MPKAFEEPTPAIVELMGHGIITGMITQEEVAGTVMLRVDVPTTGGKDDLQPGYTKFFGGGAVYSITPVDEDTMLHALATIRPRPVQQWHVPDRVQLVSGTEAWPEDEEEVPL